MASNMRTRRGGGDSTERTDPEAEAYFHWLVDQVREEGNDHRTYWDILQIMHDTEFVWTVPNDDNRLEDGKDLREEFLSHQGIPRDRERFGPCSVLEVMVAISRRLSFVAEDSAEGWAYQLLCNLELDKFTDPLYARKEARAREILHNLVFRLYEHDGTGGFFPLAWPEQDQTKIEIWSQMSAYVLEIHPEY